MNPEDRILEYALEQHFSDDQRVKCIVGNGAGQIRGTIDDFIQHQRSPATLPYGQTFLICGAGLFQVTIDIVD